MSMLIFGGIVMLTVGIVVAVLAVLLVAAGIGDRRSRRIRGRTGQVRMPGGMFTRNTEAKTGVELSKFDAGQHMVRLTREKNDDLPGAD